MTPQVDNLKNEYKNVQVPFVDDNQPQPIISAFTYNRPVIADNSLSNKLSTGDVNPAGEITNVVTNENVSTNVVQDNTNNSTLTINGYSLSQIREAMQKCGYSDIDDFAKLSDEELYNRIIKELDKCKQMFINNATLKEHLNKEELTQVFDNVITPQLFENGFFYAEIKHSVETILINFAEKGKDILLGDADTANAYLFVYKTLCQAGAVNAFENTDGLFDTLGNDFKKLGNEEKLSALKEHLDSIPNIDPKSEQWNTVWLGELARLALCSKSVEEKKIIYDFIKSIEPELKEMAGKDSVYAEMIQVIRKSCGNIDDARDVDCHISKDAETLPKEIIEDMITEYQEDGIFYDMLTPEEKEVMRKVSNEEDFEKLSPEEQALFTNCKAKLDKARENAENLGKGVMLRTSEGGDFTIDEAKGAVQIISGALENNDNGTFEEFINNMHEWFSNGDGKGLGITENDFTEWLNSNPYGAVQPSEGDTGTYLPSAYNQNDFGYSINIPNNTYYQDLQGLENYVSDLNQNINNQNAQNALPEYIGKTNDSQLILTPGATINTEKDAAELIKKKSLAYIFSGNVKLSSFAEMFGFKQYQNSLNTTKGDCLASASNNYFNKLIDITTNKTTVINTLFSRRVGGKDISTTIALKKIAIEEQEKEGKNHNSV